MSNRIKKLCFMFSETERAILVPASEGDSVTFPTNLTEVQYEEHVMWLFEHILIAEVFENVSACYGCKDERFINRLQLDSQTGSLTITNISKIHSGTIQLLIINGKQQECQTFNITVYGEFHELSCPFSLKEENMGRRGDAWILTLICSL